MTHNEAPTAEQGRTLEARRDSQTERLLARQAEQGDQLEEAVFAKLLAQVEGGELSAKDAGALFISTRRDNRQAAGLETATVSVTTNINTVSVLHERLDAFLGVLRRALEAELTPEGYARVAAAIAESLDPMGPIGPTVLPVLTPYAD